MLGKGSHHHHLTGESLIAASSLYNRKNLSAHKRIKRRINRALKFSAQAKRANKFYSIIKWFYTNDKNPSLLHPSIIHRITYYRSCLLGWLSSVQQNGLARCLRADIKNIFHPLPWPLPRFALTHISPSIRFFCIAQRQKWWREEKTLHRRCSPSNFHLVAVGLFVFVGFICCFLSISGADVQCKSQTSEGCFLLQGELMDGDLGCYDNDATTSLSLKFELINNFSAAQNKAPMKICRKRKFLGESFSPRFVSFIAHKLMRGRIMRLIRD